MHVVLKTSIKAYNIFYAVKNNILFFQLTHPDIFHIAHCSWKNVFHDTESGINKFMWSIGSKLGYDDIMSPLESEMECAVSRSDNPLKLRDGHAYFINVKV